MDRNNTDAKVYRSIEDYSPEQMNTKVVFTNGCFDILHQGHLFYLRQSRKLGDILIIGLNSDSSVRTLKGPDRPINGWEDRAQRLAQLEYVDVIIRFNEATPIELIRKLKPNVITKGGDYTLEEMIGREEVEGYGGSVIIIPFLKGYSTTKMLSRD